MTTPQDADRLGAIERRMAIYPWDDRFEAVSEADMRWLIDGVKVVEQLADLDADGDIVGGEELVVDRGAAWSTVNRLIRRARELLGREVSA